MHLMTFDADFYLHWGHQTWQQGKSVQEYLLPSKNQVALYSAKVPINPKITSQTTNLKCTWWLLTPTVTQLGNRTKSVKELPMAPNCQLLLTPVVSITLLWIPHVMHRYLMEMQLVLIVTSIPWYSSRHPARLASSEHVPSRLLLIPVVSITFLWIPHVVHRYQLEIQLVQVVISIPPV